MKTKEEILEELFYKPETQDWYKPVLKAMETYAQQLRQPPVIKSVCEKYPKPTQRYCYECEGCKKAMSEQTDGKPPVMCCGLTEVEFTERERLLELQRSRTRWFSQQEFDRLKELSEKMFANAGSPHSP